MTADCAASWLTSLLLMPSASAMAMPLAAQLRLLGHEHAVEILVDLLAPLVGILPDGDFQSWRLMRGHRNLTRMEKPPATGRGL